MKIISPVLTRQEIRAKSPAWLRFLYSVDRALLRARREADPLETAYDQDYVRWTKAYSVASQKYQDSDSLLQETDNKGEKPF